MNKLIRYIKYLFKHHFQYGWSGNYHNWKEATEKTKGYDSSLIVDKVTSASLKVKNGEAEFERDSVLFYKKEYAWPLTTAIFWIAAQNQGKLALLDFGGSLGSTYYQYKHLLDSLTEVKWCIVEQAAFVERGKASFEDERLKFYSNIESCLTANSIQALLLGCVLPYLEDPYGVLSKMIGFKIPFLIIDRMPFIEGPDDRLTIQKVPPEIYPASYPAWFFSYSKFQNYIEQYYSLIAEYDCNDKANIKSTYKGLILKLRQ